MNIPLLIIGVIAVFVGGYFLGYFTTPGVKPPQIDPDYITLRRMAIRLHYLSHEGTLSKSGDTVRFDADGPDSANEFVDTIMALIEVAQ